MKKFIVPALFTFLFVLVSCMNMSGGSEKGGSIRVALPGNGRYYVYSKENADKFVVRVIGETETKEKEAMLGGDAIEFTELEAGEYTVEAEAWDSDNDKLIASGNKKIEVEADKTTECSLTLILLSNTFSIDEDGDIVVDETKLEKTSLTTVIDTATTITGSGSEGVFIDGRTVILSPYSIGNYEVTQELFEAVMGENPSKYQGETYPPANGETQGLRPVETIMWYHAIVFCNKLSNKIGLDKCYTITSGGTVIDTDKLNLSEIKAAYKGWDVSCDLTKNGYRLPTAAEWEFAARGGYQSVEAWNYTYAGSNNIGDVAWYKDNSDGISHEVGKKNPNSLGLYDMSGNCWEFCWDITYYGPSSESVTDPMGESGYSYRSRPSGSYSDDADHAKVIQRYADTAGVYSYPNNGFRLARSGFPRAN